MVIRGPTLAMCAALALGLAACRSNPAAPSSAMVTPIASQNADGYTDITVDGLAAMLPDKGFTFVNVHVPYEGEISQTDLFIPFDQVSEHLDKLPAKDAPIVLYCRSGRMSAEAAATLARSGYTNVMELDGGFNAWQAEGHELLTVVMTPMPAPIIPGRNDT